MKKSDREIMEILEAYDATGCAHSAAPWQRWTPRPCATTSRSGRPASRSTNQ